MKNKLAALLPYLGVLALDFYLLPFLIHDTGMGMLLLLGVMPLIAFIAAIICGLLNGFCLLLPIAAFILFLPTIFIYYNSSAWIYAVAYAVIVLIGNGLGRAFYKKR